MVELLRQLCACNGVSGWEDEVRNLIRAKAEPFADGLRTDAVGNLIVFRRGARTDGPALLLSAHMDEVGLLVSRVTEEGYLRVQPVGALDRRVCIGKQVTVGESKVPGVIGMKPRHLVSRMEEQTVPPVDELYIDIGAKDREAALRRVEPGAAAAFATRGEEFGSGLFKAKAIDSRAGCAILLRLLAEPLPISCTFVFSAQREIGARGAFGAAFSAAPELALVLDGAAATAQARRPGCRLRGGPVLSRMDQGAVYDRALLAHLGAAAEKKGIPWQTASPRPGGTAAAAIQWSGTGTRVCALSVPVRYSRSPVCVCALSDVEQTLELARAFLACCADLAREEG